MSHPTKVGDIVVSDDCQWDPATTAAPKVVTRIEEPREGHRVEEGYGWTEVLGINGAYGNWTGHWKKVPNGIETWCGTNE